MRKSAAKFKYLLLKNFQKTVQFEMGRFLALREFLLTSPNGCEVLHFSPVPSQLN